MSQTDINDLVATLEEAREAYYNDDPLMSDAEFDALEDELRTLAPKHAFFKKVGSTAKKSKWAKVKHTSAMGSQNKAQTIEELEDWFKSRKADLVSEYGSTLKGAALQQKLSDVENAKLLISDKCDGISLSLVYKDGALIQAVTRGDGVEGDDILTNVLKMQGVQAKQAGFSGWLRAEVMLFKSAHKKHVPEYKNPRNAASGIARRFSDSSSAKHLTVLHYQAIRKGGTAIPNKIAEFKYLEKRQCAVPNYWVVSSVSEVTTVYEEYIEGARVALDYEIDGLVIEFADPEFQEVLGIKDGRPKGSIALKFPHENKSTGLKPGEAGVRAQVGLSGRITPVAMFDPPVDIAGVTVSKASLSNYDEVKRLGLTHGAKVLVSRRNDVIPKCEKVLRHTTDIAFQAPKRCPECNTPTVKNGAYIECPNNLTCPAQVAGNIKRWVKKLDIKDVGESLIDALVASGGIREPAGLYYLTPKVLAGFTIDGRRYGATMATKVCKNIQATRELPLARFVGSLGIPDCARSICQKLVDAGFDTLGKMVDATEAQVAAVPGLGESKAASFVNGLKARRAFIDNLLDAGVTVKKPIQGNLTGKSFCFTGFRDGDLEQKVEKAGGQMKSSVSKGLSYCVSADSTTGKHAKAVQYGVKIIDRDALIKMVG